MSFLSIEYWGLFALFIFAYWLSPQRLQLVWLLGFSYFAYGLWSWKFLVILIATTTADFFLANVIGAAKNRTSAAILTGFSVSANVSLLVFFKALHQPMDVDVLPNDWLRLFYQIGFPLGISFYTFQSLGYIFDVYRKKIRPTKNWLEYAAYVSFYPQLVAGPIERSTDLIPQLQRKRSISGEDIEIGLFLIGFGLFKKLFVADSLAFPIEAIFGSSSAGGPELVAAGVLMTFRVYADFSGYSDMARGMGRLVGIKLSINYLPFYLSTNPQAFWRCWNISLSRWISDYLLRPRDLLKLSPIAQNLHIIAVFLLIGVWHGWAWNWVAFGLFNGICVIGYRAMAKIGCWPAHSAIPGGLFMVLFYCVCGTLHCLGTYNWSLQNYLTAVSSGWNDLGETGLILQYSMMFLVPLFLAESLQRKYERYDFFPAMPLWAKASFAGAIFSLTLVFSRNYSTSFIYFSF